MFFLVKCGPCQTFVISNLFDPTQALNFTARSRYTICLVIEPFIASMMITAAETFGKSKICRDVATHPVLAEQSYSNMMRGGIDL